MCLFRWVPSKIYQIAGVFGSFQLKPWGQGWLKYLTKWEFCLEFMLGIPPTEIMQSTCWTTSRYLDVFGNYTNLWPRFEVICPGSMTSNQLAAAHIEEATAFFLGKGLSFSTYIIALRNSTLLHTRKSYYEGALTTPEII